MKLEKHGSVSEEVALFDAGVKFFENLGKTKGTQLIDFGSEKGSGLVDALGLHWSTTDPPTLPPTLPPVSPGPVVPPPINLPPIDDIINPPDPTDPPIGPIPDPPPGPGPIDNPYDDDGPKWCPQQPPPPPLPWRCTLDGIMTCKTSCTAKGVFLNITVCSGLPRPSNWACRATVAALVQGCKAVCTAGCP